MKQKWINLIAACLLAVVAAACQPAILSTPDTLTPATPAAATADPTHTPTATSLPRAQGVEAVAGTATPTLLAQPDAARAAQVEQAIDDLVDRLSIEADQVELIEVETVQWRDSSLGCPQPGMMYAQAITPGYRIVLKVDGEPYAYHGAEDRPPFLCAPDQAPTPQSDPALQALTKQATDDLAARLGVKATQIDVVEVKEVEWPDASLGCPEPGMMYAQVITPGYRIVLEAEGKTYEYHTDADRTVALCEQ